jgi:hypothetical protein
MAVTQGSGRRGTQINSDAMHGKKVRVHGKYYPALGAILVDRVEPVS